MHIVEKKVSGLIPYEKNPRHNEKAVEFVANSIEEFGFKNPIIIDGNDVVIAGHTRLLAAKKLGIDIVPCVVADDLSEAQVKAFRIADNKVSEKATWDIDLLKDELIELEELDLSFDMTDFGFADFELMALIGDMEPEGYDGDLISKYTTDEEALLKENRVIITYKPEEEEFMKELLKTESLQVKNDATTIMRRYDGI